MGTKEHKKDDPPFDYGGTKEDGQLENYPVLPSEERGKGFIRTVRQTYLHSTCGTLTTMNLELAETYAREPSYYSHTFCAGCKQHLPVAEFFWVEDGKTTPHKLGE